MGDGMKIIIEDPAENEEDLVVIRCREMDEALISLIQALKMNRQKVLAHHENKTFMLEPGEILYFEAVDNHVFIYCKDKIYESKQKLYEIETLFGNSSFFRASKSVILNIGKIKCLTPAFSGRFEALLKNGEKIIISRQYVPALKEKLGMK